LDVEIENIKKKNAYKSIDLLIYNYNLYNLNTFKDILEYQLDITTKVTNFELFLYDSNTKVETYNVVIPKLDLNEFITTSDKEYYFEINPDPRIFSNTSVNFNFPLISTPNIITDYQTFSQRCTTNSFSD
jgi:phosphorylcholine metabolism protein LicD